MAHDTMKACIDACCKCAQECEHCGDACIGDRALAACAKSCRDCAELCLACVAFLSRGSQVADGLCELCAEACDACAAECGKHNNDHCKRCAKACEQCAAECRKVAGVGAAA